MNELIYKRDALHAVLHNEGQAAVAAVENIKAVDAVPVRCKDCKWFQSGIDIDGKPFTRCNGSVRTYGHTAPDWFCADGERKDGEHDG